MTDDPTKKQNQETGNGKKGQRSGREQNPTQKHDLGNDNVPRKTPAQGDRDLETDEEDDQTSQRKAS